MSDAVAQTGLVPFGQGMVIPALLADAGEETARQTVDFFTVKIRNKNTRRATRRPSRVLHLVRAARHRPRAAPAGDCRRLHRAAPRLAPTVKQHLAAIRMLCDYLVVHGVLRMNPAAAVRGPKYSAKRGKTPVLSGAEARGFLEAIETKTLIGLRDRRADGRDGLHLRPRRRRDPHARRGFLPARQTLVVSAPREGRQASRSPRAPSRRGVRRRLPRQGRSARRSQGVAVSGVNRKRQLTIRRLHEVDVFRMIKRRASAGGVPDEHVLSHVSRDRHHGYLQNGGTLEKAQQIACHESPRTTKLYDRSNDTLTLDEIERIML